MLKYKDRSVKGVIFDVDGTIVDSLSMYLQCLNTQLEEFGFQPVSKEFLYKNLGMGVSLKSILLKIVPNDSRDLIDAIGDRILEQFWGIDGEINLLPGVTETFEYLRENAVKIGLATGRTSGADYEWEKFRRIGLGDLIDTIVTGAEVEKRKPFPDIVLRCAEHLHLDPHDCLVIGDAVADVTAAIQANSTCIAVSTGVDSKSKLIEAGADAVLERLDLVIDLFEKNY